MGMLALSWFVAVVAALVAAVGAVRAVTTGGESRLVAGGDLLMGACMAAMALPATAGWYGEYGLWWAVVFAGLTLGGVVLAVRHTVSRGWSHGRHWVHLIVGSAGMVVMTLAMTSTSSGPVLALGSSGHSMAGMPGMAGMEAMEGVDHTTGMESMPGMSMPGMTHAAAGNGTAAASGSVWRVVVVALAVYFLLSIGASVWARVRGTDRSASASGRGVGRRRSWMRWLLVMPDTLVVFLSSLTLSVWDRARTAAGRPGDSEAGHRRRRRRLGAEPDAALAAHIGMGVTMSVMLLMMAV